MSDATEARAPEETRPPIPGRRLSSVRATLVWLVLAGLLPGMAASVAVLYLSYRSERARVEQDTILTARALMQAVDSQMVRAEAAAQGLASSGYLDSGDLAAFHRQGRALLQQADVGSNFVLSRVDGQQVVNTVKPFPSALPYHGNPEQLRRVFATGKTVVSDIYLGGVLRRPVMSIDVPVLRDGKVVYDLSVGLFPERLGAVLRKQNLPPEWVATIFDTRGVTAARTLSPEKYVGGKGGDALRRRMNEVAEGTVDTVTREGIPVTAVFSRSAASNWVVAIGIPQAYLDAELRYRFLLLLAAIVVFLASGVGLALVLAGRLSGSIRALTGPALALGSGEPAEIPEVSVREAAEVASAIGTASRLLAQRTAELEAANRELEEFSYSISHDLTTPLRAIAGFAQIVEEERGEALGAEGRQALGRVRENTLRMGRLIDAFVDFTGIGHRKLVHCQVDLAALAQEAFDELGLAAPERRLRLEIGPLPPAWGDRTLLRRVMQNLIGNAAKFIPAETDGVIAVTGEVAADECRYHIADNGVGFDARFADKLFRPFERLHPPGRFEGLGIGLAIVRRIVGRHGGHAWAEGKVDEGATFHFSLPRGPSA